MANGYSYGDSGKGQASNFSPIRCRGCDTKNPSEIEAASGPAVDRVAMAECGFRISYNLYIRLHSQTFHGSITVVTGDHHIDAPSAVTDDHNTTRSHRPAP